MLCKEALLTLSVALALGAAVPGTSFSGESALEFTRKAVAFGPRPPGSEANKKLQAYLRAQLKQYRCEVSDDAFKGTTPLGPIPMTNIIARFPGTSGRAVVITGHYDTKKMPGRSFVGANDGGASTGFLLEMARVLHQTQRKNDIYLVWFDGEEAIGQWSDTDGLHGSRHLAEKWAANGMLTRIRALINVDMIGDKNLNILPELNSSAALRDLIWKTAAETGYGKYFESSGGSVEDDHMPFLRKGVNAVDLIDFDYGPQNAYWHTESDTIDKLGAHSFEVVGNVLMDVLRKLDK
jgi:glutaminyl-peptide cyclotransferase